MDTPPTNTKRLALTILGIILGVMIIANVISEATHSSASTDESIDAINSVESARAHLNGSWCRSWITSDKQYVISPNGSAVEKSKDPRATDWEDSTSYYVTFVKQAKYLDTKALYFYVRIDGNKGLFDYFIIRNDGGLYVVPYDYYTEDKYGLAIEEWRANSMVGTEKGFSKCD